MSSNKISKESLVKYIQEQVENLHKLHVLKEQKENIQKEIRLLEEGKNKKKKSKYSEKAKEFISKKMSKMADEEKPQDQKVAIALSMAREKGLKVPAEKKYKKKKLNEGFSEKGLETIKKWIEESGSREAAVKLMDNILIRMVGFSSSDLPDTATFANGLDGIEEAFNEEDYDGALEIAKDTANEMLADEGFGNI
jgi:sulfur relay (sulfurtransferase) complex TusBCD TusD component (DsrE family)